MGYQVRFTESNNPTKVAKVVEDQTLNTQTSVTFVGKNYSGFSQPIAENFLHLLENFANSTAPLNPVQGQLWFDNSSGVSQLKVYDGSNWTETGGVKKKASEPANPIIGDLWVDTQNQQLKVWTGSSWVLVGPQFSEGNQTGFKVEPFSSTLDEEYFVLTAFVENTRIAIVSKNRFTPKGTVEGFPTIEKGLTLATDLGTNVISSAYKLFGTAKRAENLVVSGVEVAAASFLRGDQTSTTNYNLYVKADGGVTIGADNVLQIAIQDGAATFYNKISGSSIDFNVNNQGTTSTVVRIDSTKKVGINKTNPQATLDVVGNIATDSTLNVGSTLDTSNITTASLVTAGGAAIAKKLLVGSDTTINGVLNIAPATGTVAILPSTTNIFDIGSSSKKFNSVYANTFVGNFTGAFTGSLASNTIAGSAQQLSSATSFSIAGDVLTTTPVVFNGVTQDGTATFTTRISQTAITGQTAATSSLDGDQILIYRDGVGLRKISKSLMFNSVATIPIGSILPYAGLTAPNGFLFCDGTEVPRTTYSQLFNIIAYTYKDASQLIGYQSFALPDLRGRFALGRDNMENVDRVTGLPLEITTKASGGGNNPQKTDAGGGSANRVTAVAADTLGAGIGSEAVTLAVSNLPDHKHNMRGRKADGTLGQQYYAYRNVTGGTPTDNDVRLERGGNTANYAHLLSNSGGILTDTQGSYIQTAVGIMNPYLTINYIIYTGVLS